MEVPKGVKPNPIGDWRSAYALQAVAFSFLLTGYSARSGPRWRVIPVPARSGTRHKSAHQRRRSVVQSIAAMVMVRMANTGWNAGVRERGAAGQRTGGISELASPDSDSGSSSWPMMEGVDLRPHQPLERVTL
jgi:hypothetical protein